MKTYSKVQLCHAIQIDFDMLSILDSKTFDLTIWTSFIKVYSRKTEKEYLIPLTNVSCLER